MDIKVKPDLSAHKRQHGSVSTWVFVGFAAVALFFLVTEHRAHLYGWLPYLLLAACPVMHLFHGHGGHGGHGSHGNGQDPNRRDETQSPNSTSGKNAPPATHQRH